MMKHNVFLSYPKPFLSNQEKFIEKIRKHLKERNFEPCTLGVTDYNMDAPLKAIKEIMENSNGVVTVAFRRNKIKEGVGKPDSDLNQDSYDLDNSWLTSPYCQIEPAMGYQLGLPIIIFREKGVLAEGILEKGVLGIFMPEFDLSGDIDEYFSSAEWKQLIEHWERQVKEFIDSKSKH
ncbi:hypothetical protein [Streptococcus cristatus]|nr:hypothetical protein [Streptococcus cristatus]